MFCVFLSLVCPLKYLYLFNVTPPFYQSTALFDHLCSISIIIISRPYDHGDL